jgi:hypothetical protein
MRDRTIVLFGGDELVVGRGPNLDGLVWCSVRAACLECEATGDYCGPEPDAAFYRCPACDGEGTRVASTFAMDEAAAGVLIVAAQEARGEIRAARPTSPGQLGLSAVPDQEPDHPRTLNHVVAP